MKRIFALLAMTILACQSKATLPATEKTETQTEAPSKASRFDRVIYVVMENETNATVLTEPAFKAAADLGVYFDHMTAETRPSQPNYLAIIAGDYFSVNSNDNVDLNVTHLGDLLEKKGLDWRVYAEGYPGNCFSGKSSGKYFRKHQPFQSFKNVTSNPARCAKITSFEPFLSDWANNRLPAFSFVVPNIDSDGHDTGFHFAGQWFEKTFGAALRDPRLMQRTLVILTFDEANTHDKSNLIYTSLISPAFKAGLRIKDPHSHYSLLKLIEDEWGLGNLGRNDKTAPVVRELLNR